MVAVLGGGLPVGAMAAVVIVLVITRRRHRRPLSTAGESSSGIATLSDADGDVMNNGRLTSPAPGKTKSSKCDFTACRSTKDFTLGRSENRVELPPGRCAKVSNVERQRSTRPADSISGRGGSYCCFKKIHPGVQLLRVKISKSKTGLINPVAN